MVFVMVKENSNILMVVFTREIGIKVQWMVLVICIIPMESLLMKENGRIMHFLDKDVFIMKIQYNLLIVSILQILIIFLNIGKNIKENFKTISKKDLVHYTWLMGRNM